MTIDQIYLKHKFSQIHTDNGLEISESSLFWTLMDIFNNINEYFGLELLEEDFDNLYIWHCEQTNDYETYKHSSYWIYDEANERLLEYINDLNNKLIKYKMKYFL